MRTLNRPPTSVLRRSHAGFTLIEVLVSLLILSVLAATAWKGVDSIGTARTVADGHLKQTLRLQSVMAQWDADLSQVWDTQAVPGLAFDGATLRLTRQAQGGVQVVSWVIRNGNWVRWASPVVKRVGDVKQQWELGAQLRGDEPGALTALVGASQWQVYCFRAGALSNCQSTGNLVNAGAPSPGASGASSPGVPAAPLVAAPRQQLPEALRLQLVLDERSGQAGTLQRDVLLAPPSN